MFVSGNIPAGAEYKAALRDVLEAFPYFQLAQVLYAKQLYDTHEPDAASRIKLASVYAPDRKAMYHLFKQRSERVYESRPFVTPAPVAEKSEVKYNFVYSSTAVDNIAAISTASKKESEEESLSETFMKNQRVEQPILKTPVEELEKKVEELKAAVEEKPVEEPKIQPFISVAPSKEKPAPVVEKPIEVKGETTPSEPPKKPYTQPAIEKKKSLYQKKVEPPVVKPLVTVRPTVVKPPIVIEEKVDENKPEPIAAEVKKPDVAPKVEKEIKTEEKKVEQPVVKPVFTPKPPVTIKPPIIPKKPEPVTASGRKPYTPPTIVFKKSLYKKTGEVKPLFPKMPIPVLEKPIIAPVVEENKVEEPVTVAPVLETPLVEEVKVAPVIEEEKKVEEPIIKTPAVEVEQVAHIIEEKKVEEPIIETPVAETPLVEAEKVAAVIEGKKVEEPIPVVEEKKEEPKEVITATPLVEESVLIVEPIADSNLKYSFNSWLKVLPEIGHEKKPEVKPVTQEETSKIIEKFLMKESSISRPKAEFFSPVKAAQKSITDDDTIVSETLANIYFMQGSLPKALKAYQSLLVQFPEKKNIFAVRIKEIKNLMRENTKPGTK